MNAHIEALRVLRELESSARASAALYAEREAEVWNDYLRRSDNARNAWRRHGEIVAAIAVLEAAEPDRDDTDTMAHG